MGVKQKCCSADRFLTHAARDDMPAGFDFGDDFCNFATIMNQLEIELKFHVPEFGPLRSRLAELGASCAGARNFEHNVRYETEDDRLINNQCLLRLRKDKNTSLTFKSPPPAGTDPRFKVARELEVRIDDFDTMDAILRALNFQPRQIYQKWRETWRIHHATVCMDTMPFGRFLEIEGLPDTIMRLVNELGLRWERRIRANYLGMFAALKDKEGLPFDDLTFDNFRTVSISFDHHCRHFEAGSDDGE